MSISNAEQVNGKEKESGYLGFRIPREYFDAFKIFRITYHKRIKEEYGEADLNTAFLYLFRYLVEKEKLDMCLQLIEEYEQTHFNVKKELRKMAMEEAEMEA